LSDADRLIVFETQFRHEQAHVVEPGIAQACEHFQWPAMKWLALRPVIRFPFFPGWRAMRFRNFADMEERLANGLQAFAWAAQAGWATVEEALYDYGDLPKSFAQVPGFFALADSPAG
jgi:hypothetical protein